ncbi:UrcA family protein [Phenylobacterium sp. VNQ135]|uniref:UrcA family protein n=1 Tax=Phenylobacterium sp. VNQ135 TaxID=3400922 RepID=UPI003BFB0A20
MRHFLLGALALALATPSTAIPSIAMAREAVAVRTGDLALNRPGHAERLLRRFDRAALDVCGASHVSVRELQRAVRATDCYARAMDEAVTAVGAPRVADLHRRGGPAFATR